MKEDLLIILQYVIAIIMILATIGLIVLEIYVWITYANTPASELPGWVLFFMFGGK